jgi:hypothetical protein
MTEIYEVIIILGLGIMGIIFFYFLLTSVGFEFRIPYSKKWWKEWKKEKH